MTAVAPWNNGTVNIGSQVDSGELALLSTSVSLNLGAPANSGIVNIDGSVNFVPSVLRATGAGGKITQTNPSAITGAPATLLTFTADSGIGQAGAPPRVAGGNFSVNNASAGAVVLQVTSSNANLTGNEALGLTRFGNAAAGGALDVSVDDGEIIHDAQLASAGPLSLSANSSGSSATITVNAAGISASGDVSPRSADALTVDSGSGAFASADAAIFAKERKSVDIGGDLTLLGGTTNRLGSAVVAARAAIDPSVLEIRTGGNVVLIGGFGANASASITNAGDILMNIGGNSPVTYTNSVLGLQTTPVGGLVLEGAPAVSGVFDSTNRLIGVEASPMEALFTGGAYRLYLDPGRAEAYIQSGTFRNFESLQRYLIFAANEETKCAPVLRGLGTGDDAGLPSCN